MGKKTTSHKNREFEEKQTKQKKQTIGERSKLHAKRAHTPLNKTTGEEEEGEEEKLNKTHRDRKVDGP